MRPGLLFVVLAGWPAVVLAQDPGASGAASAPGAAGAVSRRSAADDAEGTPTVGVKVDKAQVQIAEALTVTITVVAPTAVAVNLPTNLSLGPFELLGRDQQESDLGDGRMRREFQLRLAAFAPGDLVVPPIDLTYLARGGVVRSLSTQAITVHIASVLANEPEPALKDNAPPVVVLEDLRWPIYLAVGLLVAGLGVLVGIQVARRWRARLQDRPAPPPRPPHEIAFDKLDRLGARNFSDDEDHRTFYFQLSEIIREYLGSRFGFESLELTTDELMAQLRKRASRAVVLDEVEAWLSACDLVKFAKILPTGAEARGALETAIRIVSSTRPRASASAPPGPAGSSGSSGSAGLAAAHGHPGAADREGPHA